MSWKCQNCNTTIDDDAFEVCWNCSCEKGKSKPSEELTKLAPDCIRCQASLTFIGTKNFHEGTRWGVLGELGELFVNKENLDMYACKSCGKVEFFVAGFNKHLTRTSSG
ncbi:MULTISPECIES: hypothetical protein [Pseudoalteromonas]|uniref:RanBP2-type domain-containing protein n=1 Tax=Pseudoalteromonas amylolytica TaxID=1859457 RepID=A0A1S1MTN7_9GAMM|nr:MULTISPECIES: hypothetical protein [Pseudoalteromonas]OHU86670.1 hypothetical protein BFC16_14285 [Pseudoalteromonas sp. JW3]OHU88806.1 hypothetical protein BET10_18470 [Pseudoalteromonas amylolytica]